MRPYFIINPIAGGGLVYSRFAAAKAIFDERGAEYECVYTEEPHQAGLLAERAYEAGERFIVAVGGDGTANEVASALYGKSGAVMGILPFGTGNDLARALELPAEPEESAKLLLDGSAKDMDIGTVNGTPFVNVGGIGFDVDVVINTERYKDRFHGMLPYILGIVHAIFHLKYADAKVTANGETTEQKITICAVANGRFFGGGMAVAPESSVTDGLFDVCLVDRVNVLQLLSLLPRFIKGKHIGNKHVKYFRTADIMIECEPQPMQLDGELGLSTPAHFKIMPGALKMVMP